MKISRFTITCFVAILAVVLGWTVRPAAAHPMPDSKVMLDINSNTVDIAMHIPLVELEVAYGKPLSKDPAHSIARYHDDLAAYFARHIGATSSNGQPWQVQVKDVERGADQIPPFWIQPTSFVDAHVTLTPPQGASPRQFTLKYDVVVHQLVTHVALVSIRHDWNNGVFSDSPIVLGELRDVNTAFPVNLPPGNPLRGFASIVHLGIRHIAEGTDHLLFLLALLLPAALGVRNGKWSDAVSVRESLFRLLKIVSAFTIGHSLTLLAGAVGWVRPPEQPIEVLIALSIFVSAIHALKPIFPGREAYVAAGFGLIHGLSFAVVVADFGLDPFHTALSILGFNIGIELMQLFVVAVTVPWLLLLARTTAYTPVRVIGGIASAIAALGWMAERTFGWANPVGGLVEKIAAHAAWLAVFLAVLSVGATLWQRRRSIFRSAMRSAV